METMGTILPPLIGDKDREPQEPTLSQPIAKPAMRLVTIHEVPYAGTETKTSVVEIPITNRNLPA